MKTNLFNGDRVKLSESYIRSHPSILIKSRTRVGTITNDTIKDPVIRVRWDGNAKSNRCDEYADDQLTLVEDEEMVA